MKASAAYHDSNYNATTHNAIKRITSQFYHRDRPSPEESLWMAGMARMVNDLVLPVAMHKGRDKNRHFRDKAKHFFTTDLDIYGTFVDADWVRRVLKEECIINDT